MKHPFLTLALTLLPLAGWTPALFAEKSDDGMEVIEEIDDSATDPTALFSEQAEGLSWGGSVSSDATWSGGWVGRWPSASDPTAGTQDSLGYGLSTKLYLDGRPDKDFRFRLSLKTGYPFSSTQTVTAPVTATNPTGLASITTPNIAIWEMFTDVTIEDAVFLRFGKQSASWGVSYFYSPGDVISLTAKDASDPTAEREGPLALKATVPFPGLKANLTGFVLARETYFHGESPSLKSLGYALQADALVGEAQVSLGGFYQQDNAPKAVATLNTGLGFLNLPVVSDINLFSEAVFSWGSDVRKGVGSAPTSGSNPMQVGSVRYAAVEDWAKQVYYTGTAGASYSNSDAHLTLRAEYLYNPFGSADKDGAEKAFNSAMQGQLGVGEVLTPGVHNLTGLASLDKVGGWDKLSFSTLWQQNLSDGSGWVKPSFSLKPWDVLSFTWGLSLVYGDDGTQFPLQFQARDKNGFPVGTKTVTLNVGVTFGTGKY